MTNPTQPDAKLRVDVEVVARRFDARLVLLGRLSCHQASDPFAKPRVALDLPSSHRARRPPGDQRGARDAGLERRRGRSVAPRDNDRTGACSQPIDHGSTCAPNHELPNQKKVGA